MSSAEQTSMNCPLGVKICGLSKSADVEVAIDAGADYLGFVHYPRSPRFVSVARITTLSRLVPASVTKVILTVDAEDDELDAIAISGAADMLQLHGSESPARVMQIRERYGLPVMKAVGVADESDTGSIRRHEDVADQILVDAKPVPGARLPGGNGLAFDWRLVARLTWQRPWMLAGGLHAGNVVQAAGVTGATQVDVSTGVEKRRGEKDPVRIREFVKMVKEI